MGQVPSLSFIAGRGIILRYFSAASASEFVIPHQELRQRDAKTGRRLGGGGTGSNSTSNGNGFGPSASSRLDATPVHFDFKGNYGVSVVWSDGHFEDIFPFDVLRAIAEECQAASK